MTQLTEQEKNESIRQFKELGLCEQLAEAAATLGWKEPSVIQKQAVPHLLQGAHSRFSRPPYPIPRYVPHEIEHTWHLVLENMNFIPFYPPGRDVIGLAQTGSGKTGAFALPILQGLLDHPQPFYAMVLSPTRELAIQIAEQFEALGAGE